MKLNQPEIESSHTATYCPEDNKLRLYVGRVSHDEYLALKAEGWTSTPKQDCDFAATWSPQRRDTCLDYAGIIEDEDMEPAERSADRAERFAEYREKRTAEAVGHANRYDARPLAHGYQSERRAQRAAARHDRMAGYACDAWSKAEYWQRRTAGVISHALYVSTPSVRMGRIKRLEAEQRKHAKTVEAYKGRFRNWQRIAAIQDPEKQTTAAQVYAANFCYGYHYHHPRPESASEHGTSLHTLLTQENDPITGAEAAALWFVGQIDPDSSEFEHTYVMQWAKHYELRLAYEKQMLESQGGRLASVEIEPGGKLGGKLIFKVNKSPKTKRVTSVSVLGPKVESWVYRAKNILGTEWAEHTFNTERLAPDAYTPPTDESRAELKRIKAEIKKAQAPLKNKLSLVNPTDEDAERLQAAINPEKAVQRLTQATYSANSKGEYARLKVKDITGGGRVRRLGGLTGRPDCPTVCKVRMDGDCVIVLTDKPQKKLPSVVWDDPRPAIMREVLAHAELLQAAASHAWFSDMTDEEAELFHKARIVRFAYYDSASQFGVTDKFRQALAETANT